MARGTLAVTLALCLLVNAFCLPTDVLRFQRDADDNWIDLERPNSETSSSTADPFDDDDDDDFDIPVSTSTGGGSNIFSLLKFATALFPSSSGSNSSVIIKKRLQNLITRYQLKFPGPIRRKGRNNLIKTNYVTGLKPPSTPQFEKQVSDESDGSSESDDNSSDSSESEDNDNASVGNDIIDNGSTVNDIGNSESDDSDNASSNSSDNRSSNSDSHSEEDNAAEESVETDNENGSAKQSSDSNGDSEEDDYSDEPPGGDGQGGGILGLLAGLSGGEDGESDLGSLLAAVSGIVVSLSGDGLDLNSVIASAVGLFAGLLSEGEENPGSIIASYLLTSLDTITGGGAKNNGAFFGNLITKLLKGTSAMGESESSEENSNENKMTMADSAGFIISLLMSILGDMSKGSSGGSKTW